MMDDDDGVAASDGMQSIDISKMKHATLKVDLGDEWNETAAIDPSTN